MIASAIEPSMKAAELLEKSIPSPSTPASSPISRNSSSSGAPNRSARRLEKAAMRMSDIEANVTM